MHLLVLTSVTFVYKRQGDDSGWLCYGCHWAVRFSLKWISPGYAHFVSFPPSECAFKAVVSMEITVKDFTLGAC